jgi:hypothetical protein
MKNDSKGGSYCKVCLLPHDEEIHEATLSVRDWHRWEVLKGFEVEEVEPVEMEVFVQPQVA